MQIRLGVAVIHLVHHIPLRDHRPEVRDHAREVEREVDVVEDLLLNRRVLHVVRHTAREEIEADRGRQLQKEFLDEVEEKGPGIFSIQII